MKQTLTKLLVPLLVIGGGVAAAAPAYSDIKTGSAETANQANAYTPEEVFSAVFFGRGELAQEISEARGTEFPEYSAEEIRAQEEIVGTFQEAHPTGIDDFYDAVATGSVADARTALVTTSTALSDTFGVDLQSVEPDAGADCLIIPLAAFVVVSAWVYVDLDTAITKSDPYPNYQMARIPSNGSLTLDNMALDLHEAVQG